MTADRDTHDAVHARARHYAEFLNLPLRNHVWKGQSGDFAGAGVGSSLDFQDHRTYVPGDDPRHINWQAYARTGSYSMKLYREEVRPVVDVILDVSDSMSVGTDKEQRSLELFYFGVESALRHGASVATFLVRGDKAVRLDDDAVFAHAWPAVAAALAPGDPTAPPGLATVALRSHSLRVFISDLLYPGSPALTASTLAGARGRAVIFAPFSRAEALPEWDGNYEFIDAESKTHHLHRIEPPLLARYREAYRRHFELWRSYAIKHGIALARVPADGTFDRALQSEAGATGAIELWT